MDHARLLILLAASSIATGSLAQGAATTASRVADLQLPVSSTLGLKPNSDAAANAGVNLPFGMNYSSETKSLVMPLDQKNEWGVGLNLNLNSSPTVEQTPSSGLGLQPKRTPGVTLQKKF